MTQNLVISRLKLGASTPRCYHAESFSNFGDRPASVAESRSAMTWTVSEER